jgi:hypothetical protein
VRILPALLLTIHNVRQSHRRVYQTTNIQFVSNANKNPSVKSNKPKHKRKKIDRQLLITMLFFQVTLLTILTFPLIIQRFYSTLTLNISKTALQKAIDSFTFSLVLLLTYMALGLPFYIYTLSGVRIFRKALFKVLQNFRGLPLYERIKTLLRFTSIASMSVKDNSLDLIIFSAKFISI